jgi:hypothetical protein
MLLGRVTALMMRPNSQVAPHTHILPQVQFFQYAPSLRTNMLEAVLVIRQAVWDSHMGTAAPEEIMYTIMRICIITRLSLPISPLLKHLVFV